MLTNLDGVVWLVALLGPLLILQRNLHREIQAVFLLITRKPELALAFFSLIFLPGVLLHETSHFLMARLLGVRTGRFSIFPQALPNGKLQLGYVETASADIFRDALIGAAPLIAGGLFVTYAGLVRMGFGSLWGAIMDGGSNPWSVLQELASRPDFWLWFYLAFTVSSTMLPSGSDRRGWLPILLVLAGLLAISLLAGAGPWLVSHLAIPFNLAMRALATVLGISVGLHLILLPPIWAGRRILSKITGFQVV